MTSPFVGQSPATHGDLLIARSPLVLGNRNQHKPHRHPRWWGFVLPLASPVCDAVPAGLATCPVALPLPGRARVALATLARSLWPGRFTRSDPLGSARVGSGRLRSARVGSGRI